MDGDGHATVRAEALQSLAAASASRINRYAWEGGFFLLVLLGGMIVLVRVIRHDVKLRRRQQTFLAAVSHEFKSPLASMRLSAETLALRAADGDSRRLGQRMLEDGDRLLNMVDNLLDTTRIEEGELELAPEAVPLASAVQSACGRISEEARAHDIAIDSDVDDDLRILGDRAAVDAVLRNLLDNALKACLAGGGKRIALGATRRGERVADHRGGRRHRLSPRRRQGDLRQVPPRPPIAAAGYRPRPLHRAAAGRALQRRRGGGQRRRWPGRPVHPALAGERSDRERRAHSGGGRRSPPGRRHPREPRSRGLRREHRPRRRRRLAHGACRALRPDRAGRDDAGARRLRRLRRTAPPRQADAGALSHRPQRPGGPHSRLAGGRRRLLGQALPSARTAAAHRRDPAPHRLVPAGRRHARVRRQRSGFPHLSGAGLGWAQPRADAQGGHDSEGACGTRRRGGGTRGDAGQGVGLRGVSLHAHHRQLHRASAPPFRARCRRAHGTSTRCAAWATASPPNLPPKAKRLLHRPRPWLPRPSDDATAHGDVARYANAAPPGVDHAPGRALSAGIPGAAGEARLQGALQVAGAGGASDAAANGPLSPWTRPSSSRTS